jgi:hypothetical protein
MPEEKPQLKRIGAVPIWWHNHGDRMVVKVLGIQKDFLVLQGSAAELVITKAPDGWLVNWKINHGANDSVSGKVLFSSSTLAKAFGIWNGIPESGEGLIKRFGGTTAKQGDFIRYKKWLNIPGPGTGHDGDSNISIELTKEIKEAIQNLIPGF